MRLDVNDLADEQRTMHMAEQHSERRIMVTLKSFFRDLTLHVKNDHPVLNRFCTELREIISYFKISLTQYIVSIA